MKFSIEKKPFAGALAHIARVVERRNTYPVLANICITAEGDAITLRATDLDIEITESVAASVLQPGKTTVPASTLHDIIRKMPDGAEISFDEKDDAAVVKSGRSRFQLQGLSADSFPDLKIGTFTHTFTMAAADLARIIAKTAFAISSEETRYYLNGIYFHTVDVGGVEKLRGVATDGHRMARCECTAPEGAVGMPGIILPRKTVTEIGKLLDAGGELAVEVSDTKIRFSIGGVVLLSKLIEGTFPDYERVTPKGNNKTVTVPKSEMSKAVDRVSIVASDRGGKAIKLAFSETGTLTLEVTNPDHGSATEELTVPADIGQFEIGFNAKYLMDIISQIDSDNVEFAFNDGGSPTLIRDADGAPGLMVLMPMRV